ncbi:MAG: DNA recombination protein RmuC [Candidatus Omnitrophica bacterium]|jgi:DNA recombination protein RmuC|nr:DNA recombination protein RmuC [Candidatus Omnitrophota bacterium]MDD3274813.1 DNA recombination protein RmuC [Candidatus Omnitrophota bacterium]MDD5077981.1 DNA recombination protein RmuC [Candidatus Omnitrophota bacterium]MDD5724741.1 DNA recombination protein RmuC [Candidatus Omnitrophota bacterium]
MIIMVAVLFLILSVFIAAVVLKISSQVNERLNQMNQSLQEANKIISQNLGSATSVFGNVKEQLGKLEQTNNQIIEISRDISSLQELLRAPKFRGTMGETFLENLLSQVLPKEHYQVQYRFKSSDAVDAVIKLGERLVPVDAKFSLENFQRMTGAADEQVKESFRKKFIQDIKNRINEIAVKYILPAENTYDFALMYIPAENVYYEVIIKEDIFTYSMAKKVIPVSPNTFYAYLQVICLGLRGLKVEENAKAILKSLGALGVETERFKEDFNILGNHLLNANTKYADAQKRFDKFSERLTSIQDTKSLDS